MEDREGDERRRRRSPLVGTHRSGEEASEKFFSSQETRLTSGTGTEARRPQNFFSGEKGKESLKDRKGNRLPTIQKGTKDPAK